MTEDVVLYPQEAHYLRKNKTIALPKRVLFLATETEAITSPTERYMLHSFVRGWTEYWVRKPNVCEYDADLQQGWDTASEMLSYIDKRAIKKSPLYVICADPVMDVGASGIIPYFTEAAWELDFYYSGGTTFILVIHDGERRIKFLSYRNFLPQYIELPLLCSRACGTMSQAILQYLGFLRSHDLGGFAPSVSGQSMRAFRHRFMNEKLLIYHGLDVNGTERDAYFGGRTECFRIGKQPKKDYVQVDVNGMYPYVMSQNEYPVRLVNPRHGVTATVMRLLLEKYAVIGKCWIDTDVPIYPKRQDGKVIFPVGRFVTTLCTGSIQEALGRGHFLLADPVWCWECANIFWSYVEYFYDLRMQYHREKNEVMEYVAKLFLNSLYGKFGERRDVVVDSDVHDGNEFFRQGYWNEATDNTGFEEILFHQWRICEGKGEAPQSFPAIAAHVTDYARLHLWRLMNRVGLENLYYVDTDSMIFEKKRLDDIRNEMDTKALGFLKVVSESDHLVIHGPKDYEFGDQTKRKGIRAEAPESSTGVFTQHQYPSFVGLLRDRCYDHVPVQTVRKELHRKYDKGNVSPAGVVTPVVLAEF